MGTDTNQGYTGRYAPRTDRKVVEQSIEAAKLRMEDCEGMLSYWREFLANLQRNLEELTPPFEPGDFARHVRATTNWAPYRVVNCAKVGNDWVITFVGRDEVGEQSNPFISFAKHYKKVPECQQ